MGKVAKKGRQYGAKKEKRGKQKWSKKAKEKRKQKMEARTYERVGSDEEMKEHEDLMKFGNYFSF